MTKAGLCDPEQVLNCGITRGGAMRLFELDESLIETTFSNQFHPVVQGSILRDE